MTLSMQHGITCADNTEKRTLVWVCIGLLIPGDSTHLECIAAYVGSCLLKFQDSLCVLQCW